MECLTTPLVDVGVFSAGGYFQPCLKLSDLNGFMVDWRGTEMVYIWLLVAQYTAHPTAESVPRFVLTPKINLILIFDAQNSF